MRLFPCGACGEPNPLTRMHCTRCDEVLPWGFLLDAKLAPVEPLPEFWAEKWLDLIFNHRKEPPFCRYCNREIAAQAIVCPHCRRILMVSIHKPPGSSNPSGFSYGVAFASDAMEKSAELKLLIEKFLVDHPEGY